MATINIPYMFFNNLYATSSQFISQMNSGCQLVLSYVDTTYVKVAYAGSGSGISVIFPNLLKTSVSSSGITSSFSGSIDTFYYVYLTYSGGILLSTSAPDTTYTAQQTLGNDKVLVGYAGLSATNTMAGIWNVFSYYGQSALTYSTNITTCTNTYAYSGTMAGYVVPPGKTASITRTGSNSLNLYRYINNNGYGYVYNSSGTVDIGSWTPPCCNLGWGANYYEVPQGYTFTIAKNYADISGPGVFNITNPGLTMTELTSVFLACYSPNCSSRCSNAGYWDGYSTPTCSAASGAVTFTRQGS